MIASIISLICWLLIGASGIANTILGKAPFSPFICWCLWVLVMLYCVINLLERIEKRK